MITLYSVKLQDGLSFINTLIVLKNAILLYFCLNTFFIQLTSDVEQIFIE